MLVSSDITSDMDVPQISRAIARFLCLGGGGGGGGGGVPEPRKFFGPRIYFDILGGSGA